MPPSSALGNFLFLSLRKQGKYHATNWTCSATDEPLERILGFLQLDGYCDRFRYRRATRLPPARPAHPNKEENLRHGRLRRPLDHHSPSHPPPRLSRPSSSPLDQRSRHRLLEPHNRHLCARKHQHNSRLHPLLQTSDGRHAIRRHES